MLGVTGASGAPYAARILRALADAEVDTGVVVSGRRRPGDRARVVRRALARPGRSGRALPRRPRIAGRPGLRKAPTTCAPYASGSARTDAVVVCPCSMATVGTIAGGGEGNLIHRAAFGPTRGGPAPGARSPRDAALRHPPREPAARPRAPGAAVVPAMPAFYHLPESIADLVDFVAGRVLDGDRRGHHTFIGVGGVVTSRCRRGRSGARDVRPDLTVLRPDEPADERRPGRALAAVRQCAAPPGAGRRLRSKR